MVIKNHFSSKLHCLCCQVTSSLFCSTQEHYFLVIKKHFSGKLFNLFPADHLPSPANSSLFNFLLHSGPLPLATQKHFSGKLFNLFPADHYPLQPAIYFSTSCPSEGHYSLLIKNHFSGNQGIYGLRAQLTVFFLDIDLERAYCKNHKWPFTVVGKEHRYEK